MFLRLLLLLLVFLNLGVAGWLLFGEPDRAAPPAGEPGVPTLELLSELASGPDAESAELVEAPRGELLAGTACFSLGPFATEAEVRQVLAALTAHVARIQYRQEQSTSSRGWWVYLPALASRDEALRTARELSGHGVRDYYVVTAGDRENTISLGLFHDPENARRRRDAIAAMGFSPALHERTEQVLQFWVDYALLPDSDFDWTTQLPDRSGLRASARACF